MKTILDIYRQYKVPDNLQMHMFRAAASAKIIIDNWMGPFINSNSILRVLLLHDIGNISKSDFDRFPPNIPGEDNSIEHWNIIKKDFITRYGKDDHQASYLVGKEVGLTEAELEMMNSKVFMKNDITAQSQDYNVKIAAYVDQRVAPFGVLPLLDRLLEAKERYKDVRGSSMNNPRTDFLIDCALEIERQVMGNCRIPPQNINDTSIWPAIEGLKSFFFSDN